jgi:hypothetical protein
MNLTDTSTVGAAIYAAITGPFRGDWGNKSYKYHVGHAAFRSLEYRLSPAQAQYAPNIRATDFLLNCVQLHQPLYSQVVRSSLQGTEDRPANH